jgi:squalene-hopene/tetraprenyl-beta-curcumene cyclase
VDDTAMALLALREAQQGSQKSEVESQTFDGASSDLRIPTSDFRSLTSSAASRLRGVTAAAQRALRWMLAMQNRDGGWGAFDKDNDSQFLCRVPFADHNAMIDPSTPDLTARVLEALAAWGGRASEFHVQRAIAYLRRTQERDGSWQGRWGVNYIYGTWQTLVGLTAIGVPPDDPAVRRGANWLLACQQPGGGWGESADSYERPELRGRGPCTPSQTAWALLGLMSAHGPSSLAVQRGIRYLLDTQNPDGAWDETEFTGTGFPRVFYLRYDYYRIYFPLMALSQYQHTLKTTERSEVRGRISTNVTS